MVKFLINNGADCKQPNKSGHTVLMRAAYRGNLEVVEFFINNGADVNQQDESGCTALMNSFCSLPLRIIPIYDFPKKEIDDEFIKLIEDHIATVELLLENCTDITKQYRTEVNLGIDEYKAIIANFIAQQ